MRNHDYINGSVCTDCFVLICNGDTPPDIDEDATAAWLEVMPDLLTTPGRMYGEEGCEHSENDTDGHEYCETGEFSWSSCDHCGSGLGGTRHAVTYWIGGE